MTDEQTLSEEELLPIKMATFTSFVKVDGTGLVIQSGNMQLGILEDLIASGEPYYMLEGRLKMDRVVDGQIVPIPQCPVTLDGDNLMDLPVPCTVGLLPPGSFMGTLYTVTDGSAELETIEPGEWTIQVSADGYLPTILKRVVT